MFILKRVTMKAYIPDTIFVIILNSLHFIQTITHITLFTPASSR